MPDTTPPNILPPNTAPDLISEAPPARTCRDWFVLEAIRDLLKETGAFDGVYLSEFSDDRSPYAGALKVAIVEPADWTELDEYDDADDVQDTVKMRFRIVLAVRAGDPVFRDKELDRLLNICKNAINGQPLVVGQTIPGWTKLEQGKWDAAQDSERRQTIVGKTAYFVDGQASHDETE